MNRDVLANKHCLRYQSELTKYNITPRVWVVYGTVYGIAPKNPRLFQTIAQRGIIAKSLA